MRFGVPWSVKGIRPEARETAREAARRSGVSLGEWLNSVIIDQAAQEGVQALSLVDEASDGGAIATVNERLDNLTRRIEQLTRPGPEAYAPKRNRNEPDQLTELIGRLDRRLDQFANVSRQPLPPQQPPQPAMPPALPSMQLPPSLDRAVAEIAARQRMLNGHAAPPPPRPQPQPAMTAPPPPPMPVAAPAPMPQAAPVYAPAPAPMLQTAPVYAPAPPPLPLPAQDLSGLEDQLRNITDQIETLRKPGVEQAINALREELGEIGRTLNDAMPRRAIDAIEQQIQGLNQRIAEGRQAGIDAGALGGIEHGLAEVRDALRGLTPAENLVGFNEAVDGLAHKIDLIVAQKDPATLAQLESAITTLREMTGHIADNDTVHALAEQVHALGEKIEYIAHATTGGDVLNHLEQRISALADALAERANSRRRGAAAAGSAGRVADRQDRAGPAHPEFGRQPRRLRPSRGPHRQAGGEAGRFQFAARPSGSDRARPGRPAWCTSRTGTPKPRARKRGPASTASSTISPAPRTRWKRCTARSAMWSTAWP